jgi:carbamoyl-phosphate synthase large subunit
MSHPTGPVRVLVSSAGGKVPLMHAVNDAARRFDQSWCVLAGDAADTAVSAFAGYEFWHMPRFDEIRPEALLEECLRRNIRVVVPTRDGELAFWALHADSFRAEGITVLVSSLAAVELAMDKLQFGALRDIPVVPTWAEPIGDDRFVVKERYGAGSQRVRVNVNREEALRWAEGLSNPVFQPYIHGQEISMDAWCNSAGKVHGVVVRDRTVIVDGEAKVTTTFRDSGLEQHAATWFSSRGFRGPIVAQAIIDNTGAVNVIEVNARFGGASTAGIAVGLDVFFWSLLECMGAPVPGFVRHEKDVRQVRISIDRHIWSV